MDHAARARVDAVAGWRGDWAGPEPEWIVAGSGERQWNHGDMGAAQWADGDAAGAAAGAGRTPGVQRGWGAAGVGKLGQQHPAVGGGAGGAKQRPPGDASRTQRT